ETFLRSPMQSQNTVNEHKTTPVIQQTDQNVKDSGIDMCKTSTPDSLEVPKAFKYPERQYRSPTDSMMSPVSKGLLARNRKGGVLLPSSIIQTKIQELRVQDVGLLQN
ncbi:hypothetical protein CFOL_v3_27365, partial [Cephalotus follicularis]